MPEKTEAQKRAQKKYMEKFVEIKVRVTPEKRTAIQEHAQSMGESATTFINRAIDHEMERDGGTPPEIAGKPSESTQGAGVVSLPSDTLEAAQRAAGTEIQPTPVDKVKAAEELFRILGDLGTVDLDKARCDRLRDRGIEHARPVGGERLGIVYLPPDILETVQRAAERTGETVVDFLARAVSEQQGRDDRSFKMGINPA